MGKDEAKEEAQHTRFIVLAADDVKVLKDDKLDRI